MRSAPLAGGMGFPAAAIELAMAIMLAAISVAAQNAERSIGPPETIPRGLALGLLYSIPAVIGALGAIGQDRALLFAAAILALAGSVLAFSGVTLMFLIPALLFGYAGARTTTPRWLGASAVLMTLIVFLGLGAGGALFGLTDARCWAAAATPSGTVYRISPFNGGSVNLSGTETAGGCDTGLISARGAALASVLGLGAIGLTGWSSLGRDRA